MCAARHSGGVTLALSWKGVGGLRNGAASSAADFQNSASFDGLAGGKNTRN
jgi:hypothetical protein